MDPGTAQQQQACAMRLLLCEVPSPGRGGVYQESLTPKRNLATQISRARHDLSATPTRERPLTLLVAARRHGFALADAQG